MAGQGTKNRTKEMWNIAIEIFGTDCNIHDPDNIFHFRNSLLVNQAADKEIHPVGPTRIYSVLEQYYVRYNCKIQSRFVMGPTTVSESKRKSFSNDVGLTDTTEQHKQTSPGGNSTENLSTTRVKPC